MEPIYLFLLVIFSSILFFFTVKYTYWKRRNVISPPVIPLLGNYKDFILIKKTIGVTVQSLYEQFPNEPFIGAYFGTEPVLIPRDIEMIKTIMAKDFHMFSGRLLVDHEYRDPFINYNVFSSSGDSWKILRQNLNPLFTTGKLKSFFHHMCESGQKLDTYLDLLYKQSDVQDFKDVATRYVLELIGSCLYGLNFEAMIQGDSHVKKMADKIDEVSDLETYKTHLRNIWPNIYHLFSNNVPATGGFDKMFMDLARQSFESRNYKPIGRKDFVDFLLTFKEQGFLEGDGFKNTHGDAKRDKLEVTDDMLTSQVFLFFVASFGTSSIAISFTLYELAKNSEIQQCLIDEIDKVLEKHNGEITYDAIQDMKYLDMVVSEIGRKYPQFGVITRECMSDYKFLDYNLKVEKGIRVHIPVWGIHHDPKYYPEPEKFNPERFSPEEMQKRHPYTYLGFGEGQRICIGKRFAKIQVAIGLITILRKFRMESCDATVDKLRLEPRAFAILSKDPLNLRMVPRSV